MCPHGLTSLATKLNKQTNKQTKNKQTNKQINEQVDKHQFGNVKGVSTAHYLLVGIEVLPQIIDLMITKDLNWWPIP